MTLYYTHTSSARHNTGTGHPESHARLDAIKTAIDSLALKNLQHVTPDSAPKDIIQLAHKPAYYEQLIEISEQAQNAPLRIDSDTIMSAGSLAAALHAVGATIEATRDVVEKKHKNAFCATRPPGHHATADRAMGFCLLNSVAIAAKYAVTQLGLERAAVIDFDVHHGNGTQDIFWHDTNLFYGSTHGGNLFPFSGGKDVLTPEHICNAPLNSQDSSLHFKEAMTQKVLPALIDFRPNIIFISAGFDAHRNDPLASLNLVEDDFYWITLKLAEIADQYCEGRIVSSLEGGYDLKALGQSAALHIQALSEADS